MDNVPTNNENAEDSISNPRSGGTPTLVCLNFKVPLRVRQQFKIYAAKRNMTMTELLLRLLDDCLSHQSDENRQISSPKKETKK
jgi:hypothetical protein